MLLMMLLLAVPERVSVKPVTEVVLLPIPDRRWAEGAPEEGRCGETSIQMIALHYGAWVPQPVINSLGRSTHVDLWEDDIPTALGGHRVPPQALTCGRRSRDVRPT